MLRHLCVDSFFPMGTGNCFYVSMPAGPLDSSTDPAGAARSPSQPSSLSTWQPQRPLQQQGASGDQRRPSLPLRDVGLIFSTIEQLTHKLHRLKVRFGGREDM